VVVAWDHSKVKEVLQGEAVCGRNKGATLLRRKQGSLLQRNREDYCCYMGSMKTLPRSGMLLWKELGYKRNGMRLWEECC